MSDDIYVLNGVEVVLTGRQAEREIPARGRAAARKDTLYEVTPADLETGSWKRWVRITDLYIIKSQ